MSAEGSVTRWVTALKDGDLVAAQPLWERYHRRLLALARKKLRSAQRRSSDEVARKLDTIRVIWNNEPAS